MSTSSANDRSGLMQTAAPALISGASQAILFNPFDRALYVRVKNRRKRFCDRRNFERPFQGFANSMAYRTIVGASYVFWQDNVTTFIALALPQVCQEDVNPQLHPVLVGLLAGSINGLSLNALQAVKFRMWSSDGKGVYFFKTAAQMYREGGIRIFFRGCVITMLRDSVFGIVYETTRRSAQWTRFFERNGLVVEKYLGLTRPDAGSCVVRYSASTAGQGDGAGGDVKRVNASDTGFPSSSGEESGASGAATSVTRGTRAAECGTCAFISNLLAAVVASMLSSPFNYVRSIVYGTPSGAVPLSISTLLRSFVTQTWYTYRHGSSFTDRLMVPELAEAEHRTTAPRQAPAATHNAASSSTNSTQHGGSRVRVGAGPSITDKHVNGNEWSWRRMWSRPQSASRRRYPAAAWRWANSRLNIGWGSLRVGLGMALGQGIFHMVQNSMRAPV